MTDVQAIIDGQPVYVSVMGGTGLSAYEQWLSEGNTGTVSDFFAFVGGAITKASIGLGNVDNTSDINKPVSTAQAAADLALENRAFANEQLESLRNDKLSATTLPSRGGQRPIVSTEAGTALIWETEEGLFAKFATPATQKLPYTGGTMPIFLNQDGSMALSLDSEGKLVLGVLNIDPVAKLPSVGGVEATLLNQEGQVLTGLYDGVPYTPGSASQIVGDPSGTTALGYTQAAVFDINSATLWPTRRTISYSQQGNIIPLSALRPGWLRVKGPDVDYPIGLLGYRDFVGAANELSIIIIHGQSNAAGYTGDATGFSDNTKYTVAPPLPGKTLMFNPGGVHPHQAGDGSGSAAIPMDPARYVSFTDMVVGSREGAGLGSAEVYSSSFNPSVKTLVINNAFSGTKIENLVGTSSTDAQPWVDIRAMVTAAVSIASGLGLVAKVRGMVMNQGEANDTDSVATYMGRLDVFRTKTDALTSLTSQSERIPIILCQPASTKNLDTGLPNPPALAMVDWAAIHSNYAAVVSQYWGRTNDVSTVHWLPQAHRHRDELVGHALVDMRIEGKFDWVYIKTANRKGDLVTLTFSQPITLDTDGVTNFSNSFGISYRDSTASRTVSDVSVKENIITFKVQGATGSDEVVGIATSGAKVYSANLNRNGMGRDYGNRSCIRGTKTYYSTTTGRPLWNWAAHQEKSVTISL